MVAPLVEEDVGGGGGLGWGVTTSDDGVVEVVPVAVGTQALRGVVAPAHTPGVVADADQIVDRMALPALACRRADVAVQVQLLCAQLHRRLVLCITYSAELNS